MRYNSITMLLAVAAYRLSSDGLKRENIISKAGVLLQYVGTFRLQSIW